jgi:hypothetical protein
MSNEEKLRAIVVVVAACAALVGASHDASACSCAGPGPDLFTPDRLDDAPLNTKVRVLLPTGRNQTQGPKLALRVHDTGAEVAATSRSTNVGWTDLIELSPAAPLSPSTRYEVALVGGTRHPRVYVIGTFATGTSVDTTAPHIDSIGKATPRVGRGSSSMCAVHGPWIDLDGIAASDPSRPNAQLAWGVWRGSAAGVIDATKPPDGLYVPTVVGRSSGRSTAFLTIGRSSLCDPHDFALPASGVVWLGIGAVDEAGNVSDVRKLRVDLSRAVPRPE